MDNNLVCVVCMTYNQAEYIVETMDGFCKQETNFPFVCAIIDDASTDGEQSVIMNYVYDNFNIEDKTTVKEKETNDYILFYARHRTNINCFFAVLFLKYNHYQSRGEKARKLQYISEWYQSAKYISYCEGDDYWTKPYRLHKMVTFLESNSGYVLVCHRFNKLYQESGIVEKDVLNNPYGGNGEGISFGRYYNRFVHWHTQTLCTMYSRKRIEEAWCIYPYTLSDGILSYLILKHGKGYCLNDNMAVYRVNRGGVYSGLTAEKRLVGNLQMYKDFNEYDHSFFSKLSYYTCYIGILCRNKKLLEDYPLSVSDFFSMALCLPFILLIKSYAFLKRFI